MQRENVLAHPLGSGILWYFCSLKNFKVLNKTPFLKKIKLTSESENMQLFPLTLRSLLSAFLEIAKYLEILTLFHSVFGPFLYVFIWQLFYSDIFRLSACLNTCFEYKLILFIQMFFCVRIHVCQYLYAWVFMCMRIYLFVYLYMCMYMFVCVAAKSCIIIEYKFIISLILFCFNLNYFQINSLFVIKTFQKLEIKYLP